MCWQWPRLSRLWTSGESTPKQGISEGNADRMDRHASLDTTTLMDIANQLAGFAQTPPDSAIYYSGHGIRRVLFGVDISGGDLLYARSHGIDAVIAHRPIGLPGAWQLSLIHI